MTEAQWLEVIFKVIIFDHAVLLIFVTIKTIMWFMPNWWTARNEK